MNPKLKSVIAHFSLLGWIIAYIVNSNNKDEMTNFFLRQTLGLNLLWILVSWLTGWIPYLAWIFVATLFVFWLISLIRALNEEQRVIPLFGQYFQDWFKFIT